MFAIQIPTVREKNVNFFSLNFFEVLTERLRWQQVKNFQILVKYSDAIEKLVLAQTVLVATIQRAG